MEKYQFILIGFIIMHSNAAVSYKKLQTNDAFKSKAKATSHKISPGGNVDLMVQFFESKYNDFYQSKRSLLQMQNKNTESKEQHQDFLRRSDDPNNDDNNKKLYYIIGGVALILILIIIVVILCCCRARRKRKKRNKLVPIMKEEVVSSPSNAALEIQGVSSVSHDAPNEVETDESQSTNSTPIVTQVSAEINNRKESADSNHNVVAVAKTSEIKTEKDKSLEKSNNPKTEFNLIERNDVNDESKKELNEYFHERIDSLDSDVIRPYKIRGLEHKPRLMMLDDPRNYERGYESDYNYRYVRPPMSRRYFSSRFDENYIRPYDIERRNDYRDIYYIHEGNYNLPRLSLQDYQIENEIRSRRSISGIGYGRYDGSNRRLSLRPVTYDYGKNYVDKKPSPDVISVIRESRYKEPYSKEVRHELHRVLSIASSQNQEHGMTQHNKHEMDSVEKYHDGVLDSKNEKGEKSDSSDHQIAIPDPDYANEKSENQKARSPSPVVLPREFKGPYGPEDLDEMNNPYTNI